MNNNSLLFIITILLIGIFAVLGINYYNKEHARSDVASAVEKAGENIADGIDNVVKP